MLCLFVSTSEMDCCSPCLTTRSPSHNIFCVVRENMWDRNGQEEMDHTCRHAWMTWCEYMIASTNNLLPPNKMVQAMFDCVWWQEWIIGQVHIDSWYTYQFIVLWSRCLPSSHKLPLLLLKSPGLQLIVSHELDSAIADTNESEQCSPPLTLYALWVVYQWETICHKDVWMHVYVHIW